MNKILKIGGNTYIVEPHQINPIDENYERISVEIAIKNEFSNEINTCKKKFCDRNLKKCAFDGLFTSMELITIIASLNDSEQFITVELRHDKRIVL